MRFLDTSVPLETMLASKQSQQCREIMAAIESGKETAITSPLTFLELYHILYNREKQDLESIKRQITSLINCAGLQIVDLDAALTLNIIDLATKYGIDFVDATNILLMQKYEISAIYSLDTHYDMFKGVKRFSVLAGR